MQLVVNDQHRPRLCRIGNVGIELLLVNLLKRFVGKYLGSTIFLNKKHPIGMQVKISADGTASGSSIQIAVTLPRLNVQTLRLVVVFGQVHAAVHRKQQTAVAGSQVAIQIIKIAKFVALLVAQKEMQRLRGNRSDHIRRAFPVQHLHV